MVSPLRLLAKVIVSPFRAWSDGVGQRDVRHAAGTAAPLASVTFQVPLISVATCTAEPLLLPPVVTTAVRLPSAVGGVVMPTVNCVAVADVTVPTTPNVLKETVSLDAVVENPVPLMVMVALLSATLVVLTVTTGVTVATCTLLPLVTPSTVAVAFSAVPPATLLSPVRLTVRLVLVAPVTVPVTPLLKVPCRWPPSCRRRCR